MTSKHARAKSNTCAFSRLAIATAGVCAGLMSSQGAFGQSTTFTDNGGDQAWANTANWNNGVPTSTTNAFIPASGSIPYVTINAPGAAVNNLDDDTVTTVDDFSGSGGVTLLANSITTDEPMGQGGFDMRAGYVKTHSLNETYVDVGEYYNIGSTLEITANGTLNTADELIVGRFDAVANNVGTGYLLLDSGVNATTYALYVGAAGGNGTVVQNGGSMLSQNAATIATDLLSVGTYTLNNGLFDSPGYMFIGRASATGTFNQNGGTVSTGDMYLASDGNGSGTYYLNSGIYQGTGIYFGNDTGTPTGTFYWTDGTIANQPGSNLNIASFGAMLTVQLQAGGTPTFNISNGQVAYVQGSATITGNNGITLTGGGELDLQGANSYTGTTTVTQGQLVLDGVGALPSGGAVVNNSAMVVNTDNVSGKITGTGSLTINAGILQLAAGSGGSSQGALTIAPGATLDITNNHLIINYGNGADPMSTIYGYLKSGFNNGGWNGSGIISTSIAAANANPNNPQYGIGFSDGNDKINGHPIVSGLSSGQIELKYTLLGDANLDGTVNGADFSILAANFGQGYTNWDQGNFLFTPAINGADFSALAHNFGLGDSGADAAVSPADVAALDAFAAANGLLNDVPEPTTVGLIFGMCGVGLLTRRRKKSEISVQ
jgi:autotransporter-associated beta strand protein